jgi:5-methylcytosine-specific restriction endonuclease McrA
MAKTKEELREYKRLWKIQNESKLKSSLGEKGYAALRKKRAVRDKRRMKGWRKNNRERLRVYGQEYNQKNSTRRVKWQREYAAKNRAAILAKRRAYRAKNRNRLNKVANDYRKRNREKLRAQSRERYKRTDVREKNVANTKKWVASKRGKKLKRICARRYYKENAETIRKRASDWAKNNPGKHYAHCAKRRAVKASSTIGDMVAIKSFYQAVRGAERVRCHWCRRLVPKGRRTVDHLIPLVRGGAHAVSNLVASCIPCNISKGKKTPREFRCYLRLIAAGHGDDATRAAIVAQIEYAKR